MQLEWLEDFIELAHTRSLSRAAQNRCVTHPAFGRRIRALEDWVGAPLIERRQPVALTAAGLLFLEAAQQSVELLSTARAQFQVLGSGRDEPLRIATGRTLASNFFPDWYASLTPRFGSFPVSLVTGGSQEAIMRLSAGDVDVLLIFSSPLTHVLLDPERVDSVALSDEALVPVSAPDAQGRPRFWLDPTHDGGPIPWLAFSPSLALRGVLARHLAELRWRPALKMIYQADAYEAILEMAKRGTGLAWLPQRVVASALACGELCLAGDTSLHAHFQIMLHKLKSNRHVHLLRIWEQLGTAPHQGV